MEQGLGMSDGWIESETRGQARAAASEAALAPYAEEDDGETRMFEAPLPEQRWLVQLSPFDRRSMETSRLLAGLEHGQVRRGTLVWRGGMQDWLPVERIAEFLLGSALPVVRRPDRQAPNALLAASALIVLAAIATTALLAAGGVFG